MKAKRKGFTLVELLVVIAILAILATVSVIGYLSFTEKAKQSNDESLITQLNTVLEGNEVLDGKPSTMYEALAQVEDAGYSVEKLTPTSAKNEFLWDQDDNKFVIVSADELEKTTDPSLWVIVDTQEELTQLKDNYSVYLSSVFSTTETTLDLTNGFDAGDYVGFETINFSTEETVNVTIRMNGGTLNVDAPNATVNHYGESDLVDITSVAMDSYYEYGIVSKVDILKGHLVVVEDAKVSEIEIKDDADANTISLNINSSDTTILIPEGKEENFSDVIDGGIIVDKSSIKIDGIEGYGTKTNPYLVDSTDSMSEVLQIENKEINIKLVGDLVYGTLEKPTTDTAFVYINKEQSINIDLNGHVISGTLITDGNAYAGAHIIYNDGNLNLYNSSKTNIAQVVDLSTSAYSCTRTVKNNANGNLTIDGVRITSTNAVGMINLGYCKVTNSTIESLNTTTGGGGWDNSTSAVENRSYGKLDIYESRIESNTRAGLFCDAQEPGYVNIYSGEIYGHKSYGAINGGSETLVHIYGGSYSSDVSSILSKDYYAVKVGENTYDTYVIKQRENVYVSSLSELKNTLNNSFGKKIIYNGDLSLDEHIKLASTDYIEVTGSLNFDSNGYISNIDNVIVDGDVTGVVNYEDGVYKIYDAMDFQWLNYISNENESIKVELMNDIVLPEDSCFNSINAFSGEFNGNNHTISNLKINSISADTGVFQYLINAYMHDVSFDNISISTQTSYTGGLAGMILGSNTLENITISGEINVSGASYGVAAFAGSINSFVGDTSMSTNMFINCVSNVNINAELAYNVGTIYGTSSGMTATIGVYNCSNNGNITAAGSLGLVYGYGNLKGNSRLEIIGFINNGIVKLTNGTILKSDAYLGAASSGNNIYITTYADGNKYRAVKTSDGNWSYEEVVLA